MLWLWQVVSTQDIPQALYVDRHGIFRANQHQPWTLEEELAGGPRPTQFGRVLQELADQLDLTAADHAVELWVGQVGAAWLRCRRMAMPGSKQLKCH